MCIYMKLINFIYTLNTPRTFDPGLLTKIITENDDISKVIVPNASRILAEDRLHRAGQNQKQHDSVSIFTSDRKIQQNLYTES